MTAYFGACLRRPLMASSACLTLSMSAATSAALGITNPPAEACRPLLRMDLVVLDELGYLPFSQAGGALRSEERRVGKECRL